MLVPKRLARDRNGLVPKRLVTIDEYILATKQMFLYTSIHFK